MKNQTEEDLDPDADLYADSAFGKAALVEFRKEGELDPDFRMYEAGWLGDKPPFKVM